MYSSIIEKKIFLITFINNVIFYKKVENRKNIKRIV